MPTIESISCRTHRGADGANLQQLEHVIFDVEFGEGRQQLFPIDVVDVFHDETVILSRWIADDIKKGDNVGTACDIS